MHECVCASSTLLFNLILYARVSKVNSYRNLITKSRQIGAYADVIVILGLNKNAVREKFIELEEQMKKAGLSINLDKTK